MNIKIGELDLPEHDLRATIDEESIDELADSLAEHGQLQSIGVKQKPDGRFEVVYGGRRTRAARRLGWTTIRGEIVKMMTRKNSQPKS